MSNKTRTKVKEPTSASQSAKPERKSARKQSTKAKVRTAQINSENDSEADDITNSEAKTPVKRGQKRKQIHEDEDEEEEKTFDSDALDEDSDSDAKPVKKKGRRSPQKPRAVKKKKGDEDEIDYELEDGQEVVGVVVQAPKTGHVPPGQISQNTLDFLSNLKKPECNDREWFKLHEPVYRLAEKEWNHFVEAFTDILAEVDPQIPHLPPKDVIHRIYRDIRFSNDKTPYKKGFSASFSRSGRKGIFAHFSPGGHSMIAAGSWQPGRNELATIRANIQRNPRRLRNVISAPDFVKFFGPAKPHPKGESQNIFGFEDELKTAPKAVAKDHKDIDLLKCRSFCVSHHFTDSEVLAPNFKESLAMVARVVQPFVHCLNDMMTVTGGEDGNTDEDDNDGEGDDPSE
ncbi:hypothetical protein JR316_0012919 [Psilocybe cubensis]|uniref:Uncharacterized protein n=2 Tax=Psilocybe cubensis TaxID=181762 RepID=A0ACB8GFI8_PSICU|nr:hypothetical protein JR316_0012919 [Psilocybe cubensis]KAH9474460.1 hypothetical protein JR316_0012919 [Psilocybe cubensis]